MLPFLSDVPPSPEPWYSIRLSPMKIERPSETLVASSMKSTTRFRPASSCA